MDLPRQLRSSKPLKGKYLLRAYLKHPIAVTCTPELRTLFIPIYDGSGFAYSIGDGERYKKAVIIENVWRCISNA